MMPTSAMVLAAGLGKRMRPLTDTKPKPMIEVAGRTMIDRALDHLVAAGVKRAVVNTAYLPEVIETHLAKRHDLGIIISREEAPLETGGGIARALPHLGTSPFFSMNGDIVWLDGAVPALERLAKSWDDTRMDALLLLQPTERALGYEGMGDFFLTSKGTVQRRGSAPSAPYVFTGIQIIHPRLFADAPGGIFSLNILYDRSLTASGELTRIHALVHDGDWLHIGDPQGLKDAEEYLKTVVV